MSEVCSECNTRFWRRDKGCKIVPTPLCSNCVNNNKILNCTNCGKTFQRKNGYFDECWVCKKKLCKFCMAKEVEVEGISFAFCKLHVDYSLEELKEDVREIFIEVKSADSSQN